MGTVSKDLTAKEWTLIGATPLRVKNMNSEPARIAVSASLPTSLDAPAVVLLVEDLDGEDFTDAGMNVYGRSMQNPGSISATTLQAAAQGSTSDATAANQLSEIDRLTSIVAVQGTAGSSPPALPGGSTGLWGTLLLLASRLPVLGRRLMAGSVSVVVASDQTAIPVSGSAAVGEAPTLPPLSISGVDATGAKRHIRTDADGNQQVAVTNAAPRASVVSDPDGFRMEVATTARQTWAEDFGGSALDLTTWDVIPGGTYPATPGLSGSGNIGSITYSVFASALQVQMGTTLNSEIWFLSKAMFALPLDLTAIFRLSQRLAENGVWIELVECDPASGNLVANANLAGDLRNRAGIGLTASATAGVAQIECVAQESPLTGIVTGTLNGFNADSDLFIEFRALDIWAANQVTDNNGAKSGGGIRLSKQGLEPDRMYKVRIRLKNTGTPASNTTAIFHRLLALDGQELTVEVTSGRGDANVGRAIAVTAPSGLSTTAQGNAAHAATMSGNPVPIGTRAVSAQPTAVATGQSSYMQADLAGRLVVKPGAIPQSQVQPRIVLTAVTETTLQAAVASNRIEVSTMEFTNTDTVDHIIDVRTNTASTIIKTLLVKAGTTLQVAFPWGLAAGAVAQNLTVQMREAIATSGKAVEISATAHLTTA